MQTIERPNQQITKQNVSSLDRDEAISVLWHWHLVCNLRMQAKKINQLIDPEIKSYLEMVASASYYRVTVKPLLARVRQIRRSSPEMAGEIKSMISSIERKKYLALTCEARSKLR